MLSSMIGSGGPSHVLSPLGSHIIGFASKPSCPANSAMESEGIPRIPEPFAMVGEEDSTGASPRPSIPDRRNDRTLPLGDKENEPVGVEKLENLEKTQEKISSIIKDIEVEAGISDAEDTKTCSASADAAQVLSSLCQKSDDESTDSEPPSAPGPSVVARIRNLGPEDLDKKEKQRFHSLAQQLGYDENCVIFGGGSSKPLHCLSSEEEMYIADELGSNFCLPDVENELISVSTSKLAGQLNAICAKVSRSPSSHHHYYIFFVCLHYFLTSPYLFLFRDFFFRRPYQKHNC